MKQLLACLVLAALFLAAFAAGSARAATSSEAPWWDPPEVRSPQDFRHGWNLRAPLRVDNDAAHPLRAGDTVVAHLDAGRLASEAGWPSADVAGVSLPRGFTFDLPSIRLVRYDHDWSRIVAEVSTRVLPTWLEADQSQRFGRIQIEPFEASTSATVTLVWSLPAQLAPGQSQFYYAYFDVLENSHKAAPQWAEPDQERLDAAFWTGRGTEFYGADPGKNARNLEILGLHDNTRVSVYLYPPGLPIPRLDNRPGVTNPFVINANQLTTYSREIGPSPTFYKIVADQPILVNTFSPGAAGGTYVPSTDAGMAGRAFHFNSRSPGIFVSAPSAGPDFADVTITGGATPPSIRLFAGESQLVVLSQLVGQAPGAAAEVRVQSSAPILVQLAPVPATDSAPAVQMSQVQVPSELGSPIGRRFFGAVPAGSGSGFQVVAHGATARLQALDPPRDPSGAKFPTTGGVFLTDPGIANHRFVPSQALSPMQSFDGRTGPGITESHIIRSALCDEWPCTGADPVAPGTMSVLAGNTAMPGGSAHGGQGGLAFEFKGGYVAFAHYNNTHVSTIRLDTRPPTLENVTLDKDMYHVFSAPAQAPITLQADKPVAVFAWPMPTQSAYLRYAAAGAATARVTIGQGELRGYLLGLSSPLGEEPVFVTGRPGDIVRVPIEVQNLGRWPGLASFTDAAALSAEASTPDWPGQARLEPARLDLGSRQTKTTELVLELPSATTGAISFQVEAVSEGNPNMRAQLQVVLFVQQSFGVRLWFGDVGGSTGPRTVDLRIPPRGEELIDIVLQNLGSAADSFRLTTDAPGGQWSAELLRNGRPVQEVTNVPPLGKVALKLRIVAPATEELAAVFTQIEAQSFTSESAADRIVALARLSFGIDLHLSVEEPSQPILPGGTASFAAHLLNDGKEPVRARLRLVPQLATGWTGSLVGEVDAPLHTEVTLFPRQATDLTIEVTAPTTAAFRSLGSILLMVDAGEEPAQLVNATTVVASVSQTFGLSLGAPIPLQGLPNSTLSLSTGVRNTGNWVATIRPITESVPAGWTLTSAPLNLAAGAAGQWTAKLAIPASAHAGEYPVRLRLEGGQPDAAALEFKVNVGRVHDATAESPTLLLALPADVLTRTVTIENHGNGPESLRLEPVAGNAVELTAIPSQFELAPGDRIRVTVYASVPPSAPDGLTEPQLRLTSADGGIAELVGVPIEVARPNLGVVSAQIIGPSTGHAGDTLFVLVRVRNEGRVGASNVTVALLRDGAPVDAVSLARVAAGENSMVTLRASVGESSELRVSIDPEELVLDLDRSDNDAIVGLAAAPLSGADANALPTLAILTALAVAVWARRWRP